MKIALVSPEVIPFSKTGGLADVSGALPAAINGLRHKCIIITPLYRQVLLNNFRPKQVKKNIKVYMGGQEYIFNLCHLQHNKTDTYFIDNKNFFDRKELYGTPQGDYPDNALRFAFFAKAALAAIDIAGGSDVIHCNDWQSALIPFYLRFHLKDDTKVLFTIHNMSYQGQFERDAMRLIDIPDEFFIPERLEFYGKLNLMKAGILYSNAVSTVSRGYAKEILTEEFGCGLDGLLRTRSSFLFGILNGANYEEWNPATDKYIVKNYDEQTLERKTECKKDLLNYFKLSFNEKKPVISMVTRLAEQKGIDLVAERIEEILSLDTYYILLGVGSEKYNNLFMDIAKAHKKSVGVKIGFDNALAHKIEAGSDMFLMPSRFEPCGLNQMYSLKYGTIPVVRATGGLDDTIEDFRAASNKGNGFKFRDASGEALYSALRRAVELYRDRKKWRILQKNGFQCDFSWKKSAEEYCRLYKMILGGAY